MTYCPATSDHLIVDQHGTKRDKNKKSCFTCRYIYMHVNRVINEKYKISPKFNKVLCMTVPEAPSKKFILAYLIAKHKC